jgi:small subunit ribosomal protein S9
MADQRFYATGKRKTSVARVWLSPGSGKVTVNKRPVEEFFGREIYRTVIQQPFALTDTAGQYDVLVNVAGGGTTGQAEAIRHGISKALVVMDSEQYRTKLKRAGFITRDARKVERKKYGQPGARKNFQFSKR